MYQLPRTPPPLDLELYSRVSQASLVMPVSAAGSLPRGSAAENARLVGDSGDQYEVLNC